MTAADFTERFRQLAGRRFGLHFDDTKREFLEEVLRRRVEASGRSAAVYLDRLETPDAGRDELRALAQELTVPETYFFRHLEQLRAFTHTALSDCAPGRPLRVLSAGCASGEEPYSLAILSQDHLGDGAAGEVSIRAVDVNPAMIEKAVRGRYSNWSLRDTPEEIRRRWFRAEGRELVLDESVRAMVSFEERNLAEDDPAFWQPEAWDVVFCRNVLMYFVPEIAQALVARIARALAPGGLLFLGHAENLRGLSQDFHLLHTHGTFYYQRKETLDQPRSAGPVPIAAPLPALVDMADSWVDAIRRAADRIQTLAETPARDVPAPAGEPPRPGPPWDLGLAVELFREERFAEALALVRALPPESARDPDVLLLRAALLTHSGALGEAERACTELLALDELNAGAHYLRALCREGAGDRAGAVDRDQAAAYLDPGFAMPRLHLGLLAHRAGDLAAARRELGLALLLLQREEAPRLLLFGGGFGREALVALCRAEIVACGGAP